MAAKVSIQGYEGSFHQVAAQAFFGKGVEVLPCATFREVVKLAGDKAQSDGGVMAIENSIAGSILPNYNLLQKSNLHVVGEVYLQIHQNLLVNKGVTLEDIKEVHSHPMALLQCLDYLAYIDHYHERIRAFHVKDAELNPTGKQGVYGGYQSWINRAGRFRSLGDGQVDFKSIFSKLTAYDFDGWAVMEWECAIKHPEDGAREGAVFIQDHIIRTTEKTFDDFASAGTDEAANRHILGLQ